MKLFFQLSLLTIAVVAGAKAGVIFAFDNPDQTALPGDTLQFFGTITNTGTDPVFFNSDDLNFTGGPSFSVNDLFGSNVPISLDGGLSSGDIELFDISLSDPFTDPFGLYGGSDPLIGGVDGGSQDTLASANFSVTAQEPVSATPEPSSLVLVGAGFLALTVKNRRQPSIPTS